MIVRMRGLLRAEVDFSNMFSGSCFLVGGGYQLTEVRKFLEDPRVFTMAMNNAATQFTPDLWVGADPPACYSPSITLNPTITKFLYLRYSDHVIEGQNARELANMFFMARKDAKIEDFYFLDERRCIGWWKNVHTLALELLYRLGFRKIYMVGCGLKVEGDKPYCYESDLEADEIEFNKNTYRRVTKDVQIVHAGAAAHGLELISCTPDSTLNDFLPYMPFTDALAQETVKVPPHRTKGFRRPSHSGLLGKPRS